VVVWLCGCVVVSCRVVSCDHARERAQLKSRSLMTVYSKKSALCRTCDIVTLHRKERNFTYQQLKNRPLAMLADW